MSERDIYSVARLNREARALLEGHFPLLWLEGEISNLARPRSGHLYFSIKDEFAQVRCAMFRMKAVNLRFAPRDGMQVLMRVRISLYEPRGDFQLVVEHMEEAGDGALRRAFEALRLRLDEQGLFAPQRKRALPLLPRCIGVVTSPSGAAIHDILQVLKRRFAAIPVVLYPVAVQGAAAAQEIATAIRLAGQRNECDVLIVGRGGGSLEDLWAFNEEVVAQAIHASPIPIVSAVGHEVDVSIADLVADVRAPTPSAAAELVSPDGQKWQIQLQGTLQRLQQTMQRQLRQHQQQLQWLQQRLIHPGRRLQQQAQRLDELELRLGMAMQHQLRHRASRLALNQTRLARHHPAQRLQQYRQLAQMLARRLEQAMNQQLARRRQHLAAQAHALETVSPLATLSRGYAIIHHQHSGELLRDVRGLQPGDQITARLHRGRLDCRIEEIHDDQN
ncbi:MAG: exodeoxyribonuclease VII large subunit [Gammaproteobacteria bacterium]|nr:exodeoxyribonuclease VII large subunit [Gammaproteobacteria bacterium]